MATYRTSAAGGGSSGTGDRTATITPAVGDLLVVFCVVSANTNDTPTCSDNNGSGTYTLINVAGFATSAHRVSVFVRTALMVNTTSTIVTCATGSNTAGEIVIVAVSGMTRTGASAVRQSAIQANAAANATASTTFGVPALTANMCLSVVGAVLNPPIVTNPGGFTTQQNVGQASPNTGNEVVTRDSGHTSSLITWGTCPALFATISIELDASSASATLTAATVAFTLTGTVTGLLAQRKLSAVVAAFALTGNAAGLAHGYRMTATAASFALTGNAANLKVPAKLTTATAAFTLSGTATGLRAQRKITAAVGAFTLAGVAATVAHGYRMTAAATSFTLAGTATNLRAQRRLTAAATSFALAGTTTGLLHGARLIATAAAFALAGTTTGLRVQRKLTVTAGAFTLAGTATALNHGYRIVAAAGAFTFTGNAASLVYTPSGPGAYTLPAAPASFALTGTATGLRAARLLPAATGAFTLTAQAANLRAGRQLSAAAGVFTLAGTATGLRAQRRLTAGTGAFALTGQAANLVYTPIGGYTMPAVTGAFALTGTATGLRAQRRITAAVSSFVLTGQVANLLRGRRVITATGAFALSGTATQLRSARRLAFGVGAFAFTGRTANLFGPGQGIPLPNVSATLQLVNGRAATMQQVMTVMLAIPAASTFTGDETPLSEGGAWVSGPGASGAFEKLSGRAGGVTAGVNGAARWVGATFPGDQWSELTLAVAGGSESGGVRTRIQGDTDASGYVAIGGSQYDAGSIRIFRCDDSGSLAYNQLGGVISVPAWVAGDKLRLWSVGDDHSVYQNGVLVGSVTDATYAGGQPGIECYDSSAHAIDAWEGGDVIVEALVLGGPAATMQAVGLRAATMEEVL